MRKMIEYEKGFLELISQWDSLSSGFTFIKIYSENNRMFGNAEWELYLFGFGIRLVLVHNEKQNEKKFNELTKILEEGDFVEI